MVPEPIPLEPPSAKCARCAFHIPEICESPLPAEPIPAPRPCAQGAPSDEELIRRHRLERERAQPAISFGLLFERHYRHVVAWICRITRDLDLSLDLAQDVFVKLFTRLDAFRAESRFTTWLYTVSRNCFHDYLKARAARPREVGGEALLTVAPVASNDAVARLEKEQTRRLVGALLRDACLDDIERCAILMHYRDDMPLAVITATLGLANTSGAKAPIVSAKRKLRVAAERWTRRHEGRIVA